MLNLSFFAFSSTMHTNFQSHTIQDHWSVKYCRNMFGARILELGPSNHRLLMTWIHIIPDFIQIGSLPRRSYRLASSRICMVSEIFNCMVSGAKLRQGASPCRRWACFNVNNTVSVQLKINFKLCSRLNIMWPKTVFKTVRNTSGWHCTIWLRSRTMSRLDGDDFQW